MPKLDLGDVGRSLVQQRRPSMLLSDIDGTLVGRKGSIFRSHKGDRWVAEAVSALLAAHEVGLKIALISGRPSSRIEPIARLLGIDDYIAEMGTLVSVNGRQVVLKGAVPERWSTPVEGIVAEGALEWILQEYEGCLELHEPLPQGRMGSVILRGQIDVLAANKKLSQAGFNWLRLVNNGDFRRPFSHLGEGTTSAFHLMPIGVSKADAALFYLKERGVPRQASAGIGDSPGDLDLADVVGTMFMVANGARNISGSDSREIIMTKRFAGEGWADAVNCMVEALKDNS